MSTGGALPNYRRHSKTFTGCWTCRARKVKCDEGRPACRQCIQKGFTCDGYGVRLQWIPSETGDTATNGKQAQPVIPTGHRSSVAMSPPLPVLPVYKIEQIMFAIDSLSRRELRNAGNGGDSSQFFECFGVFDMLKAKTPVAPPVQATSPSQSKEGNTDATPSSNGSFELESLLDSESLGFSQPSMESDMLALATSHHTKPNSASDDHSTNSTSAHDVDEWSLLIHDTDIFQDFNVQNHQNDALGNYPVAEPSFESIPRSPPISDNLSHQEKFLMHHYTSKVVRLFGVLENTKSPWQTIHIPRALQSAGELVIHGSTPASKNALRNALLSISAFSMANEYKTQSRLDEAQMWSRVATSFRGAAIKHLKEAVESGFSNGSRLKYKECLATMLSMISINVMSGDTESCGVHLDGAYRMICQARNWKSKYSNKAQALHRIYFFLRTIYESTRIKPGPSDGGTNSDPLMTGSSPEGLSDLFPDYAAKAPGYPAPGHYSIDMCTYTHIYGIPHSLLVLLARTVGIVNMAVEERGRTGTRALSSHLAPKCDEMETSIMDWSVDPAEDHHSPSSISPSNSEIMEHMTRAFHNAIIIYFAQHVRLLGFRYLQPFVVKVIESVEAIEQIKARAQILAAPLWWPVFIAASEAFDSALQERFRKWYSEAEVYGFGCVRTDYRVLSKVWEQGPCPGATLTSIWRAVIERTGDVLLLS